jgi:hypothetical protein
VVPRLKPLLHDGFISGLRAYSRSAFVALAKAADPQMRIKFLPSQPRPKPTIVVFCRPGTTPHPRLAAEPQEASQS